MLEQTESNNALTGSCRCGSIRYTVRPTVHLRPYACHCTECQAETGSAFALQMWLLASDLKIEGDLIEGSRLKPDGSTVSLFACPICFSRIFGVNNSRPHYLVLRAGTLDDSSSFAPDFHLWTKSKQPWVAIPDGALALKTQVNSAEEFSTLLLGRTKLDKE
jgi:hypothetical protein